MPRFGLMLSILLLIAVSVSLPLDTVNYAIKWDGEWQITYETLRDMGLAYAVGMILIY